MTESESGERTIGADKEAESHEHESSEPDVRVRADVPVEAGTPELENVVFVLLGVFATVGVIFHIASLAN